MNQVTVTDNLTDEDLRCPITFELFHDPVLAEDGHVYEREAITRWISEYGTSPFTRQPLQINELQPDVHRRELAEQRRNSTASSNVPQVSPNNVEIQMPMTRIKILKIIFCIIFIVAVPVGIVLGIRYGLNRSSYSLLSTIAYNRYQILSNYSNSLVNNSNSVFIRPYSLNQTAYYQTIQLTILNNGSYTFFSSSNMSIYDYLYDEYFNASNPLAHIIGSFSSQSSYSTILISGNYSLVVSSYAMNTTGNFTITISGESSVILH